MTDSDCIAGYIISWLGFNANFLDFTIGYYHSLKKVFPLPFFHIHNIKDSLLMDLGVPAILARMVLDVIGSLY